MMKFIEKYKVIVFILIKEKKKNFDLREYKQQ